MFIRFSSKPKYKTYNSLVTKWKPLHTLNPINYYSNAVISKYHKVMLLRVLSGNASVCYVI